MTFYWNVACSLEKAMAPHSSNLAWKIPWTEEPGGLTGCGEVNGPPLQYSCLGNPMAGGAWWAAVQGVSKSRTWLSDLTFSFHFPALEKEMATHSSVLAWRIPGTGSHRVGHDWSDLAAAADSLLRNLPALELPIILLYVHSCFHPSIILAIS